jgi:glycosyltransferase involved in cell wall biosynthesis
VKVALLIPSFLKGKGGAERVASQVANLIAGSGGEAYVLCNALEGGRPSYPLAEEARLTPTDLYFDDDTVARLAVERFDLTIGFAMSGFYSRIPRIAALLGTPFVIQECNNPVRITRQIAARKSIADDRAIWLRQAVLAHAAGVRLTVPAYRETVVADVAPFARGFYNAILLDDAEPSGQPDRKLIGVGIMKNANKNGMAAVEAFCRFARTRPDWSLHLYGVNGFEAELERARLIHPTARIVDHGLVDSPAEIYGGAHALLIPSFDEGLPNVVVEAFSKGIPCIGYADCPGVRDLIVPDVNGLLLDRSDRDSLHDALVAVADEPTRERLGAAARQFAQTHLRYDTWAENWTLLMEQAAAGLDREGAPRTPAARDPDNPRARLWSTLVELYAGPRSRSERARAEPERADV